MRTLAAGLLLLSVLASCGKDEKCSCSVSNNGVSQSIACGESACVNGKSFACSATGTSEDRGACTPSGTDGGSAGGDPSLCSPPKTIDNARKNDCSGSCGWSEMYSSGKLVATWCSPVCVDAADCDKATGQAGKFVCSEDDGSQGLCVPACDDTTACPAPFKSCGYRNSGRFCQ